MNFTNKINLHIPPEVSMFLGEALALATLVGPLAGGLIATLVTLGIAALLGLWAKKLWETRQ